MNSDTIDEVPRGRQIGQMRVICLSVRIKNHTRVAPRSGGELILRPVPSTVGAMVDKPDIRTRNEVHWIGGIDRNGDLFGRGRKQAAYANICVLCRRGGYNEEEDYGCEN